MAFPLMQLPIGTPEQTSPFNNLVHNALKTYQQQVHAKYAPEMMEADIFSKGIGPIATLAASPNFTGFNPEVSKMLGDYIGQYIAKSHGQPFKSSSQPLGYPSGEDIYHRLEEASKVTEAPGGRGNVGRSAVGGILTKLIGNNPISQILGGGNAADKAAELDQAKADMAKYLQLQNYSQNQINEIIKDRPGESYQSRLKRWKQYLVKDNAENPSTSDRETDTNINEEARKFGRTPNQIQTAAEYFNVKPEMIIRGLQAGITNDKEMADYVKGKK